MVVPKFFLISANLTEEQTEALKKVNELTPVDVAILASPQYVQLGKLLTENVTGLHRPIAIIALSLRSLFSFLRDIGSSTSLWAPRIASS